MKKTFCAAIAAALVIASVGCFAGCGGGKTHGIEIPLDVDMDNKPTLNICLQATGYTDEQMQSDPTAALIDRLTGYKTKYSQVTAIDDGTEEINIAFINKTPYHAIKITKRQYNQLLSQDALLDIKPALERYGKDLLADISEYSWSVVSKDGGIYGIPEGGPPTLGQENVVDCLIFRKDLIYKAIADGDLRTESGAKILDLPKTRDEFTAVLRYFKNKNGDTYRPLTLWNESALIPAIAVSFDIYQEWSLVDGKYIYYLDHPNFPAYCEYMRGLYEEGLIDLDAASQDKAGAIKHFGNGDAIAYCGSLYELDSIVNGLETSGQMVFPSTATGQDARQQVVNSTIGVVGGLADSKGEVHTYHRGGYTYVTVIPWWMNEDAAYTVDYLNKKISDNDETGHIFREIVLGNEGVHYRVTTGAGGKPEYHQNGDKFKEKDIAGFFCTGINERTYDGYYACRAEGGYSKPFGKTLNRNADTEGTYNPLSFTNYLTYYDTVRPTIEKDARDGVVAMLYTKDGGVSKLTEIRKKWHDDGGTKGSSEVDAWCKANWDGKYKVS